MKNYIPSISAVTGITPQTYLWRTAIALHATPRFAVIFIYYNHYLSRLHLIPSDKVSLFKILLKVNFCLNFVENSCLVLVTYITNRENYRKLLLLLFFFCIIRCLIILYFKFFVLIKIIKNKNLKK